MLFFKMYACCSITGSGDLVVTQLVPLLYRVRRNLIFLSPTRNENCVPVQFFQFSSQGTPYTS